MKYGDIVIKSLNELAEGNKMKDLFKNNEYVWWNNEGWLYLGMDEDGMTHLYRPLRGHPFHVIEFEQLGVEDLEDFYSENGRSTK